MKFTTELEVKFVPFTVNENCASPTNLEVGLMLAVVGAGLLTAKFCTPEVPPPGAGLVTVIAALEVADVRSDARIVAVT